eukprot:scaffold57657_cov63-Phaeocystis_antarctica.AAC.1
MRPSSGLTHGAEGRSHGPPTMASAWHARFGSGASSSCWSAGGEAGGEVCGEAGMMIGCTPPTGCWGSAESTRKVVACVSSCACACVRCCCICICSVAGRMSFSICKISRFCFIPVKEASTSGGESTRCVLGKRPAFCSFSRCLRFWNHTWICLGLTFSSRPSCWRAEALGNGSKRKACSSAARSNASSIQREEFPLPMTCIGSSPSPLRLGLVDSDATLHHAIQCRFGVDPCF